MGYYVNYDFKESPIIVFMAFENGVSIAKTLTDSDPNLQIQCPFTSVTIKNLKVLPNFNNLIIQFDNLKFSIYDISDA